MVSHHRPQAHRDPLFRQPDLFLLHRRRGGDRDPDRACDAAGRSRQLRHVQPPLHHARHHHGVVLPDPVDPQHARQFHRAADDRRARPRLSQAQSAELVPVHARRRGGAVCDPGGRRRYRLDLLYAVLDAVLQQLRCGGRHRRVHRRLLLDPDWPELHRHDSQAARARSDLVPTAAVHLVALCDLGDPCARNSRARDDAGTDRGRAPARRRHIRSQNRRRPAAVPASVLVLLASGGLHHDPARHGRDQRTCLLLLAQAGVRLQIRGVGEHGDRGSWLSGLGPPHVRQRAIAAGEPRLFLHEFHRRGAVRNQGLQLDRDTCTRDRSISMRRCCMRSPSSGCSPSAD